MGMWQGIARGYQSAQQRRAAEEDRELTRRRLELAEKEFDQNSMLKRLELIKNIKGKFGGVTSTKRSGGKSGNVNVNRLMNVLTKRFNVPKETLSDLYASGGVEAIKSAHDLAIKYDEQFRTGQFTGASPESVIGEMLNTAIVTAPETRTIDWESIEAELGMEIDEATREMVGSEYTVPGAVDYTSPALIEKPSLSELDQANKMGISNAESLARDETNRITNRINQLRNKETLDSNEQAELDWLTERGVAINNAMEAYKNDSFTPLIELYGSEFMSTIKEFYPNLEDAPLNPAFSSAAEREISVPNRAVAAQLLAAGILRPGMTVRNMETGRLIPIGG